MGTVHDFPERLRREEWPAEFIQLEAEDDALLRASERSRQERAARKTIGLARQLGKAVVCAAIGLAIVDVATLTLNAAFARYAPAPASAELPVNP